MSTQEGLKENSLLTGYIVRFEKDSQKSNDEYFIRNSDVAINESTFESESIEDFKAFPIEINDQSTLALDNIVNRRERKKELFTYDPYTMLKINFISANTLVMVK